MRMISKHLQAGYTLLEFAIVVAILGVLVAGGLTVYQKRDESYKYQETKRRIKVIDRALQSFYAVNGFLPCPANGAEPDGTALFGIRVGYHQVISNACNPPQGGGVNGERKGVVPVRSLGLEDEMAYDGWGRRFSYQLSPGLGSAADFMNEQNKGVIQVINQRGVRVTDAEFGAAYVVISHGSNGAYGYTRGGVVYTPTGWSPTTIESENSSGTDSNNINNSRYMMGVLSRDFDDITHYRTKGEVYLVRRMVRPIEIRSEVCTDARTIVNYGDAPFRQTTYGAAYTAHSTRIFQVARAIDRLCTRASPLDAESRVCARNMLWLGDRKDLNGDGDVTDPGETPAADTLYPGRVYPDCYCPVDLNAPMATDRRLQTDMLAQEFGRCI